MPESFVFYESYLRGIELQSEQVQAKLFLAVCRYALRGEQPQGLTDSELGLFELIRPTIDANTQRRESAKKGGGQKGNSNAKKRPMVELSDEKKRPMVDFCEVEKRPNGNETETVTVNEDEDVTERSAPDYSEVALTADEMNELVGLSDRLSVNTYIKKLSDWQAANKKRSVKAYTVIKGWITQDKAAGSKSCVNFPADDNENKSYTVEKLESISRNFMLRNRDLD